MGFAAVYSRVFKALSRQGLAVARRDQTWHVSRTDAPDGVAAEVLLPDGFPLEGKALAQLMDFAGATHPDGHRVLRACATPDFHPGDVVPVGAVVVTPPDMVLCEAIGTDINCGMRLHVADLTLDAFMEKKHELTTRLKGDLLLGTRDLPLKGASMAALFRDGVMGFTAATRTAPGGQLARSDFDQIERETEAIYDLGSYAGALDWAPPGLLPGRDETLRDGGLATVGGGNHFVEFQVVDTLLDRRRAWSLGLKAGQIACMIHSGSRGVGVYVGRRWNDKAREAWPPTHRHPESGIFPLVGAAAAEYLTAMQTAANYGFVNRLLLAETVRLRMREVFGAELAMPLVFDVPHNIVFRENGLNVHRKGATPAHAGQPVLIPGSMGHPSYVLEGLGNPRFECSASHGAGRAKTRNDMVHCCDDDAGLGLTGVECITLRPERLREEAPAAYKDIGPVVDVQVRAGIAAPVARTRPLMTFKA
jgi:tRNA-splicing ligase RtcB